MVNSLKAASDVIVNKSGSVQNKIGISAVIGSFYICTMALKCLATNTKWCIGRW